MVKITSWLLILIVLLNSCTYYRLRQGNPREYSIGLEDQKIRNSRVFVHVGDSYFELRNWKKVDDKIIGKISEVSPEIDFIYQRALINPHFRASKTKQYNLLQTHLFLSKVVSSDSDVSFEINTIEKVQILDENAFLTTISWVATSAVITTGAIGALLLIACSCPHVYVNDGQQWYFSNSLFTGALNPTLERFDYKKISDFTPQSTDLSIELRNEEKEIQYSNLLKLVAVYHKKGDEIIPSSGGSFVKVINKQLPLNLSNDNGELNSDKLTNENDSYIFNSIGKDGFSTLNATFQVKNPNNSQLIIGAKNPKWGGYIYHEFTKLFGSFFQKWVKSNTKKSKQKLEKNIEKAGINLTIEVFDNGKWNPIEKLNLIGEAKFEKVAIEIPVKFLKKEELKVRLKSGFQFWEINSLVLAEKDIKDFKIEEIEARIINETTKIKSESLSKDDTNYLIHKAGEEAIKLNFSGIKTRTERTLYLKSKGYYKTIQNYDGNPNWNKLLAINKKGGLSNYSKEKFEEWNLVVWQLSELGLKDRLIQTK
jgi:hypothetical protein